MPRVVKASFVVLLVFLLIASVFPKSQVERAYAAPVYNYAEALQKSIIFYEAEKSGPGITGGRLDWRGDSEVADGAIPLDSTMTNMSAAFISANRAVLDPDGNGSIDVSGGFHDAGDHVKFGLPQSYAGSTLGWAYYEFKNAFVQSSQDANMKNILKWFNDYFLRSTFRDSTGKVVAFNYQVGDGTVDHNYWGPPELQSPTVYKRPAWLATSEKPASDQAAGAAASLAINYLNFKDTDLTYANKSLDTAKALYTFARQFRGLGFSGGFYNSSYDEDELSWAAVWLYTATNDATYLTDIESQSGGIYTGYLKKIINSTADNWQNIWVHSWDTVWGGVFVRLAAATNKQQYIDYARWNIEYWGSIPHQNPADTNFLAATPAGYKVINTWGSNRYNAAAQFQALVFHKYFNRPDFINWAKGQMDYIMGSNPYGRSYIVGFGTNYFSHPHHRACHGSETNAAADPPDHRHVCWGALLGGPDMTDTFTDNTNDFVYTEVAIDYNAGFVGALAGHYTYFGQGQLPIAGVFPPPEPATTEFYSEGKIEQESNQRSQITVRVINRSLHPPHFEKNLSVRYYFNISELLAAGQNINAVTASIIYDEQKAITGTGATMTGPVAVNAAEGIYYVEFNWGNAEFYGPRALQFGLVAAQDANFLDHWNATNDWSHQGLPSGATAAPISTNFIPVYRNGVKVFGQEPVAGATTIPPSPTRTNTPGGPTPTRTNTPGVPTNTPNSPAGLSVQIRSSGTDNNQQTAFAYLVKNSGTSAVSNVSVRVYFTLDGTNAASNYMLEKYYDQSSAATLSAPTLACGSTYYIAVNYGTASLAAGGQWELQTGLHLVNWGTNFSSANDHFHTSYAVSTLPAAYTNHNYLPAYVNGTLSWGLIPACGGITATPITPTTVPPTTVVPPTRTNTPVTPTRVPTTAVPTTAVPTTALPTTAVPPTRTPTRIGTTAVPPTRTPTRIGTTAVPTTAVPPTRTNTPVTPTRVPTTAVPTTAVPTTVVPTTAPSTLRVQYKAADTLTGDNQLKPHFRIFNTGTSAVALSELKIRYYFTKDNTAGLVFTCDWAQVGCANVSGAFVSATGTNTDTYLELSFAAGAGSIAAGGNTGEIQARVNHSDWTNFNESNDFSFDATKTAFADWNRVVLLQNGVVVWGTQP